MLAETRAVLVDIMVIMGRQVMPGVNGKYIVSSKRVLCQKDEGSCWRKVWQVKRSYLVNLHLK